MTSATTELIGYAGAVCNAISFVPQLLRVIELKSAPDVSFGTFLIFAIGSGLWIVYEIHFHALPVILANTITLLLSFSTFVLKLHDDKQTARRFPL